jgi:hypothetical protein
MRFTPIRTCVAAPGNKAAKPLVQDFPGPYPGTTRDCGGESGSDEASDRFQSEVAAGQPSARVSPA